jgi:hypothetical protein
MALSSLELIAACQREGLLSKEAAVSVLRTRDRLLKQAISKEANSLFKSLRRVPAGVESAVKPAEKAGFFKNLLTGGRTGTPQAAAWSDVTANLAKMMALAGMTAGATAGLGAIMRHSRDSKLQGELQGSYKTMMQDNPELARPEVRENTRKYFEVLARFAPSIAAEPAAAAPLVTTMSTQGTVEMPLLKTLAETQARIDDAAERRRPLSIQPLKAGEFAAKAMLASGA